MENFDYKKWQEGKDKQESCAHEFIECTKDEMVNGRPIMRFRCQYCYLKFHSLQMDVNDVDRVIASKKHPGKTLGQIAVIDMPYLFWMAIKSKAAQPARYACARMCLKKPYFIPLDGAIISPADLYQNYVRAAVDFISSHGGKV